MLKRMRPLASRIAVHFAYTAAVALAISATPAISQQRTPGIGYLYPAGGRQGETIRVTVGGQNLRRPTKVVVSGRDVKVTVVEYTGGFRFLNRQRQWLLVESLWNARKIQIKKAVPHVGEYRRILEDDRKRWPWKMLNTEVDTEGYELPGHPMLIDINNRSLKELAHIQSYFFFPKNKLQENRQIAEHVLLEITINEKAEPGMRELRLQTSSGLSNPMRFQIGTQPEINESEPNNRSTNGGVHPHPVLDKLLSSETLKLPVLINGQIMPGDIDRFRFRARKGEKLEISVGARALIPYLADAVPGWFQAVLYLYDAEGNEVAYNDDEGFNPDPALHYSVPSDGEYELLIRDAIYRGRQDFVYRISMKVETPYRKTDSTDAPLGDMVSDEIDALRDSKEIEPNDIAKRAPFVYLPKIIKGKIASPGDIDCFRIKGRAGDTIVAEVYARRAGSPLDSLLRLQDYTGKVLEWNDDYFQKKNHLHVDHIGLITHHADSYLSAVLPKTGFYTLQLSDAQRQGGADYNYTLRISPPKPDFSIRTTPSSIYTSAGGINPITVYALRRDGFDGPIEIKMKHGPNGSEISGGIIPAGAYRQRMTISVAAGAKAELYPLLLEGVASINKKMVRHDAVPADNTMQAFLWRHLVPAESLSLTVNPRGSGTSGYKRVERKPVALVPGESAAIQIALPAWQLKRLGRETILFKLNDPPEGITLENEKPKRYPGGVELQLKAESDIKPADNLENLIIEVHREYLTRNKDGSTGKKARYQLGFLPAIPVVLEEKL